ncbi:MAG TPA: hypothetical protein VEA92_00775 [Candidatus Paceibacterota bacterium]|nr:hypothetical protein [Candidatus Paceibacterota bacterium]
MKFGFESFGFGKKPAAETNEMEPQVTDEATRTLLEGKVRSMVSQTPELAGILDDYDMHRIANYVAIQQEKTGTPYTVQMIEEAGSEFDENVLASIQNRAAAKPGSGPAYRVVGPDGFVAGQTDHKSDIGRMAEEERAH